MHNFQDASSHTLCEEAWDGNVVKPLDSVVLEINLLNAWKKWPDSQLL